MTKPANSRETCDWPGEEAREAYSAHPRTDFKDLNIPVIIKSWILGTKGSYRPRDDPHDAVGPSVSGLYDDPFDPKNLSFDNTLIASGARC
jgi:hypothetical protein